jgi:hypothetical protein
LRVVINEDIKAPETPHVATQSIPTENFVTPPPVPETRVEQPKQKEISIYSKSDSELGRKLSPLNLKTPSGKTVEEAYQIDVKGYNSITEGKGKPPKNTNIDSQLEFTKLVHSALDSNESLKQGLLSNSDAKFTHPFATKANGADIVGAVTSYIDKIKNPKPTTPESPVHDVGRSERLASEFKKPETTKVANLSGTEQRVVIGQDTKPVEVPHAKTQNIRSTVSASEVIDKLKI